MTLKKDLTGCVFGNLTVVSAADPYVWKTNKYSQWNCECSCGNAVIVRTSKLTIGHTQSCGCLQKEKASKANKKHGESNSKQLSKEYQTWQAMKQRAHDKGGKGRYKEKGIKVHEPWINDYNAFLNDVGRAPKGKRVSLDRIDNSGDYEPGNVRWLTNDHDQAINRDTPSNNTSGVKGVCKVKNKWRAYITNHGKRINLGTFDTREEAKLAREKAEKELWSV